MTMIDKKEFGRIASEMEAFDGQREKLIKKSRDILKLSKETIYSVHRGDFEGAKKALKEMEKGMVEFNSMAKNHQKLIYSGTFKITGQEYVEAATFYSLMKDWKLPTSKDLGVDSEFYLLGLCDLSGEIVRRAINAAINEDYRTTMKLRDFVSELYGELMKFDFANGELRKKYDSIKYDVKKLEDLALELKLREKI